MNNYSFRAWHSGEKEMLRREQQGFEGDVFNWLHQGQPIVITQGTGLKDKAGDEIYEGDIVKWDDNSNGGYWRVARVKTKPGLSFECFDCPVFDNSSAHGRSFGFGSFIYTDTENHLEIIGNIFETPELLPEI